MTLKAPQFIWHKLHSSSYISIAPFLLLTASTVCGPAMAQNAPATLSLPPLGNSAEDDRRLLREVTDAHIHGEALENQPLSATQKQALSVAPATQSGKQHATAKKPATAVVAIPANGNANAAVTKSTAKTPPTNSTNAAQPFVPAANLSTQDKLSEADQRLQFDDPETSVWDIIRQGNRLPLHQSEKVKFYSEQYQREARWISKILVRGKPYLAHLVHSLDARFMPVELALLPAIESGFISDALSSGNAAGLWQIVPITAREIGIERNEWFDGRKDIITSTTAAIDYLSYLNAEFNGDWELTLAAYNAGPGRVRSAIRKNERANLPTDFWSLDLPEETRNYLPKMIALVLMVKNAEAQNLDLPQVSMGQAFESIDVGFRFSIDKAAELAAIDKHTLLSLNAGLIYGISGPNGPHNLLIPIGTGERFQEAFAKVDKGALFREPRTHQVASGDTISSIALFYGVSQTELMRSNGLDDTRIRVGQKLAILDGKQVGDSLVEYEVAIGDTLSEIAHRFSVSVADIAKQNGKPLDNHLIHPGDKLKISLRKAESG